MMRIFAACLFAFFLAACGDGPDAPALRTDVETRLDQALPGGVVEVVRFERRGSQKDAGAPSGEARRFVYFDADLRLVRDVDFGAWDAPGVAGLISALGTGPRGITGITAGGNKAGDVIRAHGSALYRRDGDDWRALAPAGYRPPAAPSYAGSGGLGSVIDAIQQTIDASSGSRSPAVNAAIHEELLRAQTNIRARLARASEGYAIAAGPENGQYLRTARALFQGMPTSVTPFITRGGEENLSLLRAGMVSLALAQGDAALDAYRGTGAFANAGPHPSLRAIGNLYPEPIHVIVRADSPAGSLADLRDQRIAVGESGSASRTFALRVLHAHGLEAGGFQPIGQELGQALVALQHGNVDAVMQVIGVPSDSVRDAMANLPLRLLPLEKDAIDAMASGGAGYFAHAIPAGTYAGQPESVPTVATAALLLAEADLSDTEVGSLTRFVYAPGQRDLVALGSAQGAQISAAAASMDLPVPQHLAAVRVLEGLAAAKEDDRKGETGQRSP